MKKFWKVMLSLSLVLSCIMIQIGVYANEEGKTLDAESQEKGKRIQTMFEQQGFTQDIKDAKGRPITTTGLSEHEKKALQIMFGLQGKLRGIGLQLELPYGVSADHEKWRVKFDRESNVNLDWSCYASYIIQNKRLYCMQPLSVAVNNATDYYEDDITRHIDNPAVLKELGYINALGYGFRDDYRDEMNWATQICIWQCLHEWAPNVYPEIRDIHPVIQEYVNIIKERVRMMKTDVSFKGQRLVFQGLGEEYAQYLRDTTNTLGNYGFDAATAGIRCERVMDESGGYNTLKVWLNEPLENGDISYYAFYDDDQIKEPYMYNSPLSQAVGDYGKPASNRFQVFVSIARGDLQITKEDEDGNAVAETSFLLSYHEDMSDPIGTYTTGEDGSAHISGLQPGNIYVQEANVPDHLVLNAAIHSVTIIGNQNVSYTQQNNWKKGKLQLRKIDRESKQVLGGAVYGIYDHAGTCVQELTTKAEAYVESVYLRYGTYTVKEIKAPMYYTLNKDVYTIKIQEDEQRIELSGDDTSVKGKIRLYKEGEVLVDMKKDQLGNVTFLYETRKLADAVFEIYAKDNIYSVDGQRKVIYKKNELVETITSNKVGLGESKALPLGSYYLKEKTPPLGYILSNEVKDVTLTYKDQESAIVYGDAGSICNGRQKVSVHVNKEDEADHTPLSNAEITLYANRDIKNVDGKLLVKKGEVLERILTDKKEARTFTIDLPIDNSMKIKSSSQKQDAAKKMVKKDQITYHGDENSMFYVAETKAPLGYTLVSPVIYYVDTAYQGSDEETIQFTYAYLNHKTAIEISKLDSMNKAMLPGALLVLCTLEGDVIEQWVSTKEPHIIKGLIPQEYVLREIKPSEGYVSADDVHFTVRDDINIQKIVMEDNVSKVEIHKVDEHGKEMPGNDLEVIDEAGGIIEAWTSSDKAHRIDKLCVGKTYILRERKPFDGYASTADIPFTIQDRQDIQKVTMQNKPLAMTFRKIDEKENVLQKALLCVKDERGQVIDEWMSDDGDHKITGLIEQSTYTFEERGAPDGYAIAQPITFTAKDNETITMKDELLRYQIQLIKVDSEHEEIHLANAQFTLYEDKACTKELKTLVTDEDGKVTFKELLSNTYYIKETKAPIGYVRSDQVYTVSLTFDTCIKENNMYILTVENEQIDIPLTGIANHMAFELSFYTGCIAICIYYLKKRGKRVSINKNMC